MPKKTSTYETMPGLNSQEKLEMLEILKSLGTWDRFTLLAYAYTLILRRHPRRAAFFATLAGGFLIPIFIPLLGMVR